MSAATPLAFWDELTPREQRIAELTSRGPRNKELAATLLVSPKTLEKHLGHIYVKLGLRSRTELAGVVLRSRNAGSASA